jgi:hypothetical protein
MDIQKRTEVVSPTLPFPIGSFSRPWLYPETRAAFFCKRLCFSERIVVLPITLLTDSNVIGMNNGSRPQAQWM